MNILLNLYNSSSNETKLQNFDFIPNFSITPKNLYVALFKVSGKPQIDKIKDIKVYACIEKIQYFLVGELDETKIQIGFVLFDNVIRAAHFIWDTNDERNYCFSNGVIQMKYENQRHFDRLITPFFISKDDGFGYYADIFHHYSFLLDIDEIKIIKDIYNKEITLQDYISYKLTVKLFYEFGTTGLSSINPIAIDKVKIHFVKPF